MDLPTTNRLLRRLRTRRTSFPYFRDRLALVLLALHVGEEGLSVAQLKRSSARGLLGRERVHAVLARSGGGRVSARDLLGGAEPAGATPFRVTFDDWGCDDDRWWRGSHQTSRRGLNLVVQLNFPAEHDRDFERLVRPHRRPICSAHPVRQHGPQTLAWARVDVDLSRREALIEELQSDWVRDIDEAVDCASEGCDDLCDFGCGPFLRRPTPDETRRLTTYRDHVLRPYAAMWQEALLAATLELLVVELAIERVLLHAPATGCALKDIKWAAPPRSPYDRLPRRFAFRATRRPPALLLDAPDEHLRRHLAETDLTWWEHAWTRANVRAVGDSLHPYRRAYCVE